jgi:AcrR family transcriptional regulator
MRPGLTAKGRATRERIVAAAAQTVRERGAANTYLEHVHAAASISNSQLFHYFPGGRNELLLAVAAWEADQILAEQDPELSDLSTPASWDAWATKLLARYTAQGPNCGLSALVSQLDINDPHVVKIIRDLYDRWQARLAAGIEALQTTGQAPKENDPEEEAAVLLAGIQGGVLMMATTGRADHLARVLDQGLARLRIKPH